MATMAVPQRHDSFFKTCLQKKAIAKDFFKGCLPAKISTRCNFSTLRLQNTSYIEADFHAHHADLLYGVDINDEQAFIYLLLEHQSTPDRWMPVRMQRYMNSIFKHSLADLQKLPVVVPLVVYAGQTSPYPYSWDLMECFQRSDLARLIYLGSEEPCDEDGCLIHFLRTFYLVDLTILSDQEVSRFGKAQLVGLLLKNAPKYDIFSLAEMAFQTCWSQALGSSLLMEAIQYITANIPYQEEKEKFWSFLKTKAEKYHYEEEIMTFAEMLKEEGIEEGIEKGLEKGLQKGLQKGREEGQKQGRQKGREEGKWEASHAIAKNLLAAGVDEELILHATGLTKQELRNLSDGNT